MKVGSVAPKANGSPPAPFGARPGRHRRRRSPRRAPAQGFDTVFPF
ncbi:hypothetical protein HMPREF9440_01540 [Sutterella parvirubra YIT 11816]|uniref:Uncharacterized protein n=1 Tax=Sutterella parvirubra YIT 11816 TaxID=762967 RepID=H3KFM1_9BURK|nr:hypothetical protein HMPREF9440_01540 [Sutterella parvirubra YIT 11816]